jgi:hypothetical protein
MISTLDQLRHTAAEKRVRIIARPNETFILRDAHTGDHIATAHGFDQLTESLNWVDHPGQVDPDAMGTGA